MVDDALHLFFYLGDPRNYAKVRAIIDDESGVSASFANTSDSAIVSGDLKKIDEGLINITGIDINAEV